MRWINVNDCKYGLGPPWVLPGDIASALVVHANGDVVVAVLTGTRFAAVPNRLEPADDFSELGGSAAVPVRLFISTVRRRMLG